MQRWPLKHTSNNLPARILDPNGGFKVGDVVRVGAFFWIRKENHISFDSDVYHYHGVEDSTGGSVDIDCELTIRGFETWRDERMAVVRLDRQGSPSGAMAPNGQVFLIPVRQMQRWPQMLKEIAAHESQRMALAKKYKAQRETDQ